MEKLFEYLGYGTSFVYAAAAFGLFYWLDENASDEAKATLANTMKLKSFDKTQVASAVTEAFDQVYGCPLLSWRTLVRSALFTLIVTIIFLYEEGLLSASIDGGLWNYLQALAPAFSFNIATDYISLFLIRFVLTKGRNNPVFSLIAGTVIGITIVIVGNVSRATANGMLVANLHLSEVLHLYLSDALGWEFFEQNWQITTWFMRPALLVFSWLPLFALGILAVRALAPLSWAVANARWFLRDGKEHPLKAVGYVAATITFVIAATWQSIFKP